MAIPTRVQLALRSALTIVLLALFFLWIWKVSPSTLPKSVKYSELLDMVRAGQVTEVELHENEVVAKLKGANDAGGATVVTDRIPRMDESELLHLLDDQHVAIVARSERGGVWSTVAWALLPFLLLPGIFWLLAGAATRRGQPLSFGRSKAKIYDSSLQNQVTFADVAGVDEARAELMEIVAFLQDPTRYTAVGARVPKGVLLVGAPGTGKTLLARAVAGESRVPFFSISGSEFVEMFVGVGAARVRDLFEQAKERAPCIIFIDELDAVGKKRAGAMGFAANEEREQTLNQLLVEMDGFEGGTGLVIMAATNRPEILDKALLRAGRFDRQVVVDRPDVRGREAILKVHARKVRLGVDADLGVVARRTPGMVGADLANVVNEAALASVRRGADKVEATDFDEAVDRIQLGLKREGRVMTEEEKRRVAFHEAGHVLVALSMKHADPVYRVTIIPRGVGALGMTLQLPTEERFLVTREELHDRLTVLMGGRAGESIACGDFSTGAQDDLERATEMARQMVCRFGMSESLGPVSLSMHGSLVGTAWLADGLETTPVSDATAHRIDGEIKGILAKAYDRARGELERRGPLLARLAKELMARETLQREELNALVAEEQRETPVPPSGVVSHPGAVPEAEEELPQFV